MQKGVSILLRLTDDNGATIVINFANVLFMEKGVREKSGYTAISMLEEMTVFVQDDIDEILASYRREWKNA
jgi:hypothetical protein